MKKLFFLFYIFSFLFSSAATAQEFVRIGKVNLNDLDPKNNKLKNEYYHIVIVVIDQSTDLKNIDYVKDNSLLRLDIRLTKFPAELDIKKLSNLRELIIESETMNDLSALKELDSLQILRITAPKINNADFLKNLPALKEAEIFSDSLQDIPRLRNSRIESLTLSVGSSTPLMNLQSFVSLKEIKFLKGGLRSVPDYLSRNMEKIMIDDQPLLKDIHNIRVYKKLRNLSVSSSGLETIEGDFSNLRMENVALYQNELLKDINALFAIKKISGELALTYLHALKAIDVSGKCFDYNTIRIRYCTALQDLTGYSECTRINNLDLSGNGIRKFPENLSVIPNLEIMSIYEPNVKTMDAIKELHSLRQLNLTVSATVIPESFYTNSNIEFLWISGTLVSDMSGLSRLKKLNELYISNANELVKIPKMDFLLGVEKLHIFGNEKLDVKKTYRNGMTIISNNKKE